MDLHHPRTRGQGTRRRRYSKAAARCSTVPYFFNGDDCVIIESLFLFFYHHENPPESIIFSQKLNPGQNRLFLATESRYFFAASGGDIKNSSSSAIINASKYWCSIRLSGGWAFQCLKWTPNKAGCVGDGQAGWFVSGDSAWY